MGPSTWPSSARPNRSSRRPRTAPRWPRPDSTPDPSKKIRPLDDRFPRTPDSRNIACRKYLMRHGSRQISLYECVFQSDLLFKIFIVHAMLLTGGMSDINRFRFAKHKKTKINYPCNAKKKKKKKKFPQKKKKKKKKKKKS